MHIWFVTPAFPPFPGGGERYAHSLARHLLPLGCTITVVTSAARVEPDFWLGAVDSADTTPQPGLRVVRRPLRPLPGGRVGLLAWRKLMVLLAALPGDHSQRLARMARAVPPVDGLPATLAQLPAPAVVHGFNTSWEYPLLAGAAWAQQHGVPFVATPYTHFGAHPRDRVARNSLMDHQRRVLAEADAVLTLTDVEADGLAAWGVRPARVVTIGGGSEPVPPVGDAAVLRARHGVPDGPFALFIGRNTFEKGAVHAAQAAVQARLPLVLAGSRTVEFERFCGRLSAESRRLIYPLGLIDERDKHTLLAAAALLVLPSRTDSFGLVFLEAWGHGKPVIGARAGGIPGVVTDGADGLLVPFGDVAALADAMRRLVDDPALAQRLGAGGRARLATHFNWQTVAARVMAVYRSVTAPAA